MNYEDSHRNTLNQLRDSSVWSDKILKHIIDSSSYPSYSANVSAVCCLLSSTGPVAQVSKRNFYFLQ